MIGRYLTGGLALIAVSTTVYATLEKSWRLAAEADLKAARTELAFETAQLAACAGRLQSVLDDVRSDNEIDTLPDSALTDVPDHWLRPDDDPARSGAR
jgi:hypothetical protein